MANLRERVQQDRDFIKNYIAKKKALKQFVTTAQAEEALRRAKQRKSVKHGGSAKRKSILGRK